MSSFSEGQGRLAGVGWIKRSGSTKKTAAIGGSAVAFIDSPFHQISAYGSSADWAKRSGSTNIATMNGARLETEHAR
jgi:hypothetical protein